MQESSRRQYLALLGVDLWLPRDAVDAPATDAVPSLPDAPLPQEAPLPRAEIPDAPAATVAANAEAPRDPVPSRAPETEVATPPAAALPATDTLGCSLLTLPDGLQLIAAYVTPQAPGLSGPEHALLLNIAAALAPGTTLPAPDDFRWPPPGVRLPAVARPGAAAEALLGLLAEHRRKRQLRDVVLLGEALAPLLQEIAARLGLQLVVVPSLAAMLADPARKRACWDVLKPLRRGS